MFGIKNTLTSICERVNLQEESFLLPWIDVWCLFTCFFHLKKHTHTHTHAFNNDSEQQMCQKDKLEFKIFQVLRANDLSLVQKPFFSSFSFLFHKSMKFTFRWALNSNFITWCQNTTSTKETTIPTLPNPSNSHYAPSCDSFHLMIVHMFVAAFCWSAPHINLAYSRRSHCGESLQGDVSRKNIRGMG